MKRTNGPDRTGQENTQTSDRQHSWRPLSHFLPAKKTTHSHATSLLQRVNGYVIFVTRQYQSFLSFTVAINANTSKFNLFQWFYIHLLKKGFQQPISTYTNHSLLTNIYIFFWLHRHLFLLYQTSLRRLFLVYILLNQTRLSIAVSVPFATQRS